LIELELVSATIVGAALCFVLGANNIATCLGTTMSSQAVKYKQVVLLAAGGLMGGTIIEGGKLSHAVTGGVTPTAGPEIFLAAALSSFLIMVVLTVLSLPISVTQVFVGAIVGAAIARATPIDFNFTALVVISWIMTPLAGIAAAALISFTTRAIAQRVRRVIMLNKAYTWLTIAGGFYSAYVLGANGVGLVAGASNAPPAVQPWIALIFGAAAIIGMVIFGRGTTRSVAENIVGLNMPAAMAAQVGSAAVVHGFTQVGMPVSISQAVVGGIFGAAVPRKIVVRNSRLVRELLLGWTASPLIGATLAFILASLL
jgi:PiT family inorganic phosphate transporter